MTVTLARKAGDDPAQHVRSPCLSTLLVCFVGTADVRHGVPSASMRAAAMDFAAWPHHSPEGGQELPMAESSRYSR